MEASPGRFWFVSGHSADRGHGVSATDAVSRDSTIRGQSRTKVPVFGDFMGWALQRSPVLATADGTSHEYMGSRGCVFQRLLKRSTHAKRVVLCLSACLFVLPAVASATQISLLPSPKRALVNVSLSGAGTYNYFAGELNWEWTSTVPNGYDPTFYAYCVDLTTAVTAVETVAIRSTDLLVVSGIPDAGGKAAWLFNTYAPTVNVSGTSTDAAALQVAIWEALYDTSGDVTSGNFTLNTAGDIATKAMTYLSALYSGGGAGYQTAAATWLDAPLGYGQDQMALMPVPEPTSLALCGLGLLGLAGAIRRKRRATRAVPTA